MNLRRFYPLRLSGVCFEAYFVLPVPVFCRLRQRWHQSKTFAFVAAVVLNVAMGEGGRLKAVFAFVFCALARRDDAAFEVCMVSDLDLIAVFSGINTALLGYGGMVCFDFALAVTAACTESVTTVTWALPFCCLL